MQSVGTEGVLLTACYGPCQGAVQPTSSPLTHRSPQPQMRRRGHGLILATAVWQKAVSDASRPDCTRVHVCLSSLHLLAGDAS